jgi:hypothetical protein
MLPSREDFWASRLPYIRGVFMPYGMSVPGPDNPGYWLDGNEHYCPIICGYNAQNYSIKKKLAVTDYSKVIDAGIYNFRDLAVRAIKGPPETPGVPAWHTFTRGISHHWKLTKDPTDIEAINFLISPDYFPNLDKFRDWYSNVGLQRENALYLDATIDHFEMELGEHPLQDVVAEIVLDNIAQWTTKNKAYGVWLKPFMGALSCRALIHYWFTHRSNSNKANIINSIPNAIIAFCDYIYEKCWYKPGVLPPNSTWDKGSITYIDLEPDSSELLPILNQRVTEVIHPRRAFCGPLTLPDIDDYFHGANCTINDIADGGYITKYIGATREFHFGETIVLNSEIQKNHTFKLIPPGYNNTDRPGPVPDLNHMIFPAFAWAHWYLKTIVKQDNDYDKQACEIFDGCLQSWQDAYTQKVWNQSLLWTTDGLQWLEEANQINTAKIFMLAPNNILLGVGN